MEAMFRHSLPLLFVCLGFWSSFIGTHFPLLRLKRLVLCPTLIVISPDLLPLSHTPLPLTDIQYIYIVFSVFKRYILDMSFQVCESLVLVASVGQSLQFDRHE